eukprot:599544-Prymnesium_polylepis.1
MTHDRSISSNEKRCRANSEKVDGTRSIKLKDARIDACRCSMDDAHSHRSSPLCGAPHSAAAGKAVGGVKVIFGRGRMHTNDTHTHVCARVWEMQCAHAS